ncbi:tyrosyl-DNA phosphodiesterase 1 [Thoreauomyces humboldtii]|nr:tyrosyl-DNA phosphodiesterase 1 [Thoreauomyces humboldtii]
MKRSVDEAASSNPVKRQRVSSSSDAVVDLTVDDYDSDSTEILPEESARAAASAHDSTSANPSTTFVDPCIYLTRVPCLGPAENVGSKSIREVFGVKPIASLLQLNYMFELGWMMSCLPDPSIPTTIVHGERGAAGAFIRDEARAFPNVRIVTPNLPIPFGTHHTKAMFFRYRDDSMQIIIHTANMIERDWGNKTQGLWVSPILFRKSTDSGGTSSCAFEQDLLGYMDAYGRDLASWRERISQFDFRECKAILVASVPGRHSGRALRKWGHLGLRAKLNTLTINGSFPLVVAQFSSIGSLGMTDDWVVNELGISFAAGRNQQALAPQPRVKLVFPSVENVRTSYEGWAAGGAIPFQSQNWKKQHAWMRPMLCSWVAETTGRYRAMPHIKTFTRLNPDTGDVAWFLLTSSNLSKAAWGSMEKQDTQLMVRSFELGVLIAPEMWKVKFVYPVETFFNVLTLRG